MNMSVKRLAVAAMSALAAGVMADTPEHSDAEIKAQFVFAGRCRHVEDMDSNYDYAFRMAAGDTNRYVRVLSELAEENTNQIKKVIGEFLYRKPPQSLPFLYSYATNAAYGAQALKSIFAIEGVTSNSIESLRRYLNFTNVVTSKTAYEKAVVCSDFLEVLSRSPASPDLKDNAVLVVRGFASEVSTGVSMIDAALVDADNTYRYSKRRLSDLRAAYPRCFNEYQTSYVTNAINELVAYPESALPD